MIRRMMTSAVFAGVTAGCVAAALHFTFVQQKILLAETYENGSAIHFAGVPSVVAQDHAAQDGDADHAHGPVAAESGAGAHDHPAGAEPGVLARNGLTLLFMALLYAGYGMILVAGFATAQHFGRRVTAREGLLWGIAGFATVQLVPAMGLPPELPGIEAADLAARQIWWAGTAVCTAGALALLGYGRTVYAAVAAVGLLTLPFLIGAPELDGFAGVVPPEVAAAFAARVLGVGLVAWALLGWLSAHLWNSSAG
jgi:cobalt transporter subunit CbtA